MVRKGSSVRVRQRAFEEALLAAGFCVAEAEPKQRGRCRRQRRCPMVPAPASATLSFFEDVARDVTFWATMASVQVALVIAVVLEGRTAREDFDRTEFKRARSSEDAWKRYAESLEGGAPASGDAPPSLVRPLTTPDQGGRAARVFVSVGALVALAVGTVLSVLQLSPLPYVGWFAALLGFAATVLCFLGGLGALLYVAITRMTS